MSSLAGSGTSYGPSKAIAELRFAGIKSLKESLDIELKSCPDLTVKSEIRDSTASDPLASPAPKPRVFSTPPGTKTGIKTRILPIKLDCDREWLQPAPRFVPPTNSPPLAADRAPFDSKVSRLDGLNNESSISSRLIVPKIRESPPSTFPAPSFSAPRPPLRYTNHSREIVPTTPSSPATNAEPFRSKTHHDTQPRAPVVTDPVSQWRTKAGIIFSILIWVLAIMFGYWLGLKQFTMAKNCPKPPISQLESTPVTYPAAFNRGILADLDRADASAGFLLNA